MWSRATAFAKHVIPETDELRKLVLVVSAAFGLGVGAGEVWRVVVAASGVDDKPQGCEVLARIKEVQAVYNAQLEPVQDRWLKLTESLERNDMLPSQRTKTEDTARMVRDEMDRLRGAHIQLMEKLSNSCGMT